MRCVPFLLLASVAVPAAAQTAAPDIVVTGRGLDLPPGTPAYGSVVLDRERLASDASGRLENVLLDVAGFQQFRRSDSRSANPTAQGATLRALGGNAASRALVLLDGVPVADPFFGYIPWSALDPAGLAAVRVTRGGGAGPFGSGAVAGTIELISASRAELSPVTAQALYGSRDAQELALAVTPSLGGGFASLFGRYDRGDGFATTPRDQRTAASVPARYASRSLGGRAVVPVARGVELQARSLAFDDRRTLRFRGADSVSSGQDASVRLVARGRWQLDVLAYLQARDYANKVVSATSFRVTLDQRATPSTGYGGKIELRPPLGGGHLLRIGADARVADGELFEDAFGATGTVTARRNAGGRTGVSGLFVENDWTLGRLTLAGGLRADRWTVTDGFFRQTIASGAPTAEISYPDRRGTELTARGGVLFAASDRLNLRVAAYRGFRLPTLNELYRPFVVFPVTTQANAALDPERLTGFEVGLDATFTPGVTLALTAFANRLSGAIANVTIGPNLRQRRNVDAIRARGIEATLAARRGPWSLAASYALSDNRVRAPGAALDGKRPAQSPGQAASATLAWNKGEALASATLRYVGNQFEDDLETDRLPGVATLDLVARVPLAGGVALIGRAENALDATVLTRNQGGSMDLGTPRTLWIGLKFGG